MKAKILAAGLIWSVFILILCAIPGDSLPSKAFLNIPHFDKIVHAGLYLPYAFLIAMLFSLSKNVKLRKAGPLITLLIVFVYGGLIELMQEYLFIHRSGSFTDLLADLTGGIGGLLFYYLFYNLIKPRLPVSKS
jgi:VanZ family protein